MRTEPSIVVWALCGIGAFALFWILTKLRMWLDQIDEHMAIERKRRRGSDE